MRLVVSIIAFVLLTVVAALTYHIDQFAAETVVDLLVLVMLPGLALLRVLPFEFSGPERIVVGASLGFSVAAIFEWFSSAAGYGPGGASFALLVLALVALVVPITRRRINRDLDFLMVLPLAMLVVMAFNLICYHYTAAGSIVTRGLFGEDIPFLAGEIHGLRYLPHLADLHQLSQSWSYHDATYRVLALTDADHTLDLLAWAFPVFGYGIMAIGVYAVADRLAGNRIFAAVAVIVWFSGAPYWGSELTSYALSPSFVVGSIIGLSVLIVLHEYLRQRRGPVALLLMVLLIELGRFKISTFLVLGPAIGLLGLMLLVGRDRKLGGVLAGVATLSGLQMLLFSVPSSDLMPAGDFLIGAPLLGYANHLAALLHVPVASVSPVTHGGVGFRSLLVIPYFAFHLLRFVVLDPRVIVGSVGAWFWIRTHGSNWSNGEDVRNGDSATMLTIGLLLIALPIGYALPVLYSPSWYPLALSFYAPLVSAQAAVLLSAVALVAVLGSNRAWIGYGVVALLAMSMLLGLHSAYRAAVAPKAVVPADVRAALMTLREASGDHAALATRRSDLIGADTVDDESYYWYSAISAHPVVSEGARYGALLAAVSETDPVKGLHPIKAAQVVLSNRRAVIDTIFESKDTSAVLRAAAHAGVEYLLETDYAAGEQLATDASEYATELFRSKQVRLWKLRR